MTRLAHRVDGAPGTPVLVLSNSLGLGPSELWRERAATVRASGTAAIAQATLERWFTPAADPAAEEVTAAMLEHLDR